MSQAVVYHLYQKSPIVTQFIHGAEQGVNMTLTNYHLTKSWQTTANGLFTYPADMEQYYHSLGAMFVST